MNYIIILYVIHFSELHRVVFIEQDVIHFICFFTFLAISLITYGLTSCIDPGYLTAEKVTIREDNLEIVVIFHFLFRISTRCYRFIVCSRLSLIGRIMATYLFL